MQPARRAALAALAAIAIAGLTVSRAGAHIDLQEPEPRAHGTAARGDTDVDANSNVKSAPCGQITTGRSDRVTTYAPGQRITVRVREENAHVSYLRVRFDLDGADFPLRAQAPAAPESQDEATAAELALGADGLLAVVRENNDTAGFVHEIEVTLPNVTCSACTLQVVQFMYDDPAAPHYFQCADLVLADLAAIPDAGGAPQDGPGSRPSGDPGPGNSGLGNSGALGTGGPLDPEGLGSVSSNEDEGASADEMVQSDLEGITPGMPGSAMAGSLQASRTSAPASQGGASCGLSRAAGFSRPTVGLWLGAFGLAVARRLRRRSEQGCG